MSGLGAFAGAMGITVRTVPDGAAPLLVMPFADGVIGRPGYLHGGAIASLLEAAALVAVRGNAADAPAPRLASLSVDYLRGGGVGETFARGLVTRRGRRVVHVTATAWQEDPARPIAIARLHLVLTPEAG